MEKKTTKKTKQQQQKKTQPVQPLQHIPWICVWVTTEPVVAFLSFRDEELDLEEGPRS